MATLKFSQFVNGGEIQVGAKIVGLNAGSSPTNAIFDFPGTGIKDSNGSFLIGWAEASGSPQNYVQFSNAESGNPAKIAATGVDPDVDLELSGKGSEGIVSINATSALLMPSGTTAQRPTSASTAMVRYNTTTNGLEFYNGVIWDQLASSSASVIAVLGTANRITSTGGSTPQIDISPIYSGQASITTVGTIVSGIWQGSIVGSAYGGTGVNNGGRTFTILGGNISLTAAGATSLTLPATTGTLALRGANSFNFGIQSDVEIKNYTETTVNLGVVSGSVNLDLSLGTVFTVAAGGNINLSTINVPVGSCCSMSLFLVGGGTPFTTSWMPGTIWPAGVAPTLSGAGAVDLLVFCTLNGGSTWYGNLAGLDYQ